MIQPERGDMLIASREEGLGLLYLHHSILIT